MCVLLPVILLVWNLGSDSSAEAYAFSPDGPSMIFKLIELKDNPVKTNESSSEEIGNSTRHVLILANKSLSAFPASIPRNLGFLDLSYNNLSVVDYYNLAGIVSLKALNLSHNLISEFSVTEKFFRSLQTLDLSYNLLSRVPSCYKIVNLQWLSLAGNPIKEIQPLSFRCMPSLFFLRLSSTRLGIDDGYGIGKSAFALRATDGTDNLMASKLTTLDLSETFLGNIRQDWTNDLRNLTVLYISRMRRLESLNVEEMKPLGLLQALICSGSQALSWIDTNIFEQTPHMRSLDLQNCNLTSFNYWNTVTTHPLNINLKGNPLRCTCELSRLLSKPQQILVLRANETACSRTERNRLSILSLSELHGECQAVNNETVSKAEDVTGTSTAFYRNNHTTLASLATRVTGPQEITSTTVRFSGYKTAPRSVVTVATSINGIPSTATPFDRNHHSSQVPTAQGTASTELTTTYSNISTSLHATGSGMILHHNTTGDYYVFNSFSTRISSAFPVVPTTSPQLPFEARTWLPTTASPATTKGIKPNASHDSTVTKDTVGHIPRDYLPDVDEEDEETTVLPNKIVVCDYHPCKHLQTPCHELQKATLCYCPGLSPDNVIPDPPRLSEVSEIADTSAQIQWCAPNSIVHQYQLVYYPVRSEHQTVLDRIYVTSRQYTIYKLSPATTYQLCVIAVNKAGASQVSSKHVSRIPCTKFKTKPSYIIILAALCTTSGILLLIIIILAAFLCRKRKSYFVDQYNTRLVSYRNPAFDYHLKIPTFN